MPDLSAWPALVLTAGLATRLRPLSAVRAKAAMPVAGTPLIGRILAWLRRAGVRRVVLNLHHRPETITRLVGDGGEWDLEVRYSWEATVLGSAGGPRRALPLLEADRFLIVNGDTLTTCDLRAAVARHLESGAMVTLAVVPGDVNRYGGVVSGPDGVVQGFVRAGTPDAAAGSQDSGARVGHFIGVQAVEARAFAGMPDDQPADTIRTLYPRLIAAAPRAIVTYPSDAEFMDVGTPDDYLRTVATLAAREGRPFDRGEGSHADPTAHLSRTILWDHVTIGGHAQLADCIVADAVQLPDGVRLERAVIVATDDGFRATAF